MEVRYSISTLSRDFDITPRTLRFYESRGIISPKRQGTTRIYSDKDRIRLALVLRARRVGLSLEEIKQITDIYDQDLPDNPRQTMLLLEKLREFRHALINKINDINETVNAIDDIENRAMTALNRKPEPASPQLSLGLD